MALIDDVPTRQIADEKGTVTLPYASWFSRAFLLLSGMSQSGTTAQRPTTGIWIGRPYYDTTLNKPVWASAVSGVTVTWRDATGTIV